MGSFLFAHYEEVSNMTDKGKIRFTVAGWMVEDMGLKGNTLLVYAYIYECSKDGFGDYHEGVQFLSDLLGIHYNSVVKILGDLVKKGYLVRQDETLNGWRLASHYKAVR